MQFQHQHFRCSFNTHISISQKTKTRLGLIEDGIRLLKQIPHPDAISFSIMIKGCALKFDLYNTYKILDLLFVEARRCKYLKLVHNLGSYSGGKLDVCEVLQYCAVQYAAVCVGFGW